MAREMEICHRDIVSYSLVNQYFSLFSDSHDRHDCQGRQGGQVTPSGSLALLFPSFIRRELAILFPSFVRRELDVTVQVLMLKEKIHFHFAFLVIVDFHFTPCL